MAWVPGTATWIAAWSILAAASVALAVLLRTRWRDVKPWKKCALLSAWVHVLLACLATNVRIGIGGAGMGPGSGGPIRVAVVNVAPRSAIVATVAPPPEAPLAAPAPEESAAPSEEEPPVSASPDPLPANSADGDDSESTPSEPPPNDARERIVLAPTEAPPQLPAADNWLEAPDLLPQPEPPPKPMEKTGEPAPQPDVLVEAGVETSEPPLEPSSQVADNLDAIAPGEEGSPTSAPLQDRGAEIVDASSDAPGFDPNLAGALVDPHATPQAGIPAAYAGRFADREAMVSGGGGNPTTERAVRAALAWLAAAQSPDGRWDAKRYGAGQERYVLGESRGGAGARADTGITALALLAFMGAGHTHRDGPYADNVARGLDYLRRSQGANGNLGGEAEVFAHMYCHSMATFAVSEACALARDDKLRPIVEKAVAYSLAAQHPTDGGWRYRSGDTGDTSQLGWQLMALKSAELAGVPVPPVTWTRVDRFLRNVERGAAGGLAAYRPEGPPSRAMTAEALCCRQLLTRRGDGGLDAAGLEEARQALLEEPPGGITVNFYYWYYATIALHRAQDDSPAAAAAWRSWNDALTGTLVGTQSGDGSWSSACVWGGYGGRVYTTSVAAMCLEVYYRYAPEGEPEGMAHRGQGQGDARR
ncbi:MAG TPA: hypothetical protein VEQ85_04750 [Lacipirellulaceae bacterium]|nr:hypothetical protein [Lacipirellulaceae bacterium]